MSRDNVAREALRDHANCARNPRRSLGGSGASRDALRGSGESRDALRGSSGESRDAFLRILTIALALTMTLLATSCSILGKAEPIRIIDPESRITADAAWPRAKWSLLVLRPAANQSLDTERIVVRPAPGTLQVYKGAAWSDTAPDLVQTALLRGFEDSGHILSVARPGGAVRGDFQLATELRAFESVYDGATPHAEIQLHARLIRVTDGTAIAAKTFIVKADADGIDVAQVGDAFGEGLSQLTRDVVAWTLTEGNKSK